jgi:Flp pilus assembly pilin Flp
MSAPDTPAPISQLPAAPRIHEDQEGSLVTEYGLLAVVAATIAGVVISWASNGALVTLFNALLRHARGIVGA